VAPGAGTPVTSEPKPESGGASPARVVVVPAGEALFRQGDAGECLYLLSAGQVEVSAREDGGPEHHLATLSPGAILGEVAVLIDAPRTATAVAVSDSRLWEIGRTAFRGAVESSQRWAVVLLLAISQALAERLGAVDGRLLAVIARDRDTDGASGARVAELEQLRRRLLADWAF